jgi:type I restriction enzyme, S subunit
LEVRSSFCDRAATAVSKALQPGDILIETAGGTKDQPTGRTVFLKEQLFRLSEMRFTCASFSRFLRVKKNLVRPDYLFWFLQNLYHTGGMYPFHIQHTGVARFQYTQFAKTQSVPVPDVSEQDGIATLLNSIDDKIDLNRRMNVTLEAMAQAIFKDWLVDFGPTRAKKEGRPPYLAPDIWALFPDGLDDDGRPEGWKRGCLDTVANVTMGASPDGNTYNDRGEGIPLVNGPVEYGDFFLRRIKWTTAPNKMSRRGDLILCVRGSTTGRHAFADGDYCLGRGVCSIRGIGDLQEFVDGCVLLHIDRLLQKTTGSIFPNLSGDDIRKFDVLIPADDVRKKYCETVRPFRDQVWANVVQSETLTSTRDFLLPKLLSGEIRVRDAEKIAEAAA